MNDKLKKSKLKKFLSNIDFLKLHPERIGRSKYLALYCFWQLTILGMIGFSVILQKLSTHVVLYYIMIIVIIFLFLLVLINVLFLKIRRLHDFDFNGWWVLLCAVPLLNFVWELVIAFVSGTKGDNRFGSQPKHSIIFNYFLILTIPAFLFINFVNSIVLFRMF